MVKEDYHEFDRVLLKAGRVTTIEDADGQSLIGTIGHDPTTWQMIYFELR